MAVMLVSNLAHTEELAQEVLMRSNRRLWLSADHHLLARQEISLADVAAEDYVMLTVDEARTTAARYWDAAGLTLRPVLTTSSVEAVRSLVAAGMGVTVLSDMVYRPWWLEGQRIEVRRLVEPIPSMDVGLAYKFLGTFNHDWSEQGITFKTGGTYSHSFLATLTWKF